MSADIVHLFFCHHSGKRQSQGGVTQPFGEGEVAFFGAEAFGNKRLPVNGSKVIAAADALVAEQVQQLIALGLGEFVGQADDENKPAYFRI